MAVVTAIWAIGTSVVRTHMNESIGRLLIGVGLVIAAIGALLLFGSRLPFRLGRLPGDIAYQKGDFSFYMPITTMLLLSALLTLFMWLLRLVKR